jgi:hypothetical protein
MVGVGVVAEHALIPDLRQHNGVCRPDGSAAADLWPLDAGGDCGVGEERQCCERG